MNTATPLNEGVCMAICFWAVLVTLMVIHATLGKRLSNITKVNDSPTRDGMSIEAVTPMALTFSALETVQPGAKREMPSGRYVHDGPPDPLAIADEDKANCRALIHAEELHSIEGTVKRVDYWRQELSVVTGRQVRHFTLTSESRLWFDDQPA